MPINNYLVIGVNPANNETSVPLNKRISITFAKDMRRATLNDATLILKKVNGDMVPYTLTYNSNTRTAHLQPTENLLPGKEYEFRIVDGVNGVKSITDEYMTVSRNYQFTTSHTAALSAPTNLSVSLDNGYPTLRWQRPADYDIAASLSYEVKISGSSSSEMAPIWPADGDINQTHSTTLNVPKKFSEGYYYAYVRALNGEEISDWTDACQFDVAAPVVQPNPGTGGGEEGISSFNVLENYPRRDDVDITTDKVMVVFSLSVDPDTVDENSIYIVKKESKPSLTMLDFMTDYDSSKRIPATIDKSKAPNIVVLSVNLESDAEYTVIVKETVAHSSMDNLGLPYYWSFMTKFSQLYGDAEMIKNDVGGFLSHVSNKLLYKAMRDNSVHAYNIVSQTSAFNAADYQDGKAPYYVHQYVRYRTAYDLLMNGYIQASTGSGSSVRLGDLTVDKKTSQTSVNSLLREIKSRIKPWEDAIHGHNNRGYAKPVAVVKGENNAYPEFLSRTEFRDLGQ